MSNNELFNQKEFPKWEGYEITDEKVELIKKLWLNDINLLAKTVYKDIAEKLYYKNMLLYIQRKLYLDEPLNLCLNSANEVFDIMISPCEILNDKGKELTLDDYDEISEYKIEHNPIGVVYTCIKCEYYTYNLDNFNHHICDK